MINKVDILPTGNELKSGIVLDTDSPMIMGHILSAYPNAMVCRHAILEDSGEIITEKVKACIAAGSNLIILIGGSGSGHMHSEILGKDCTVEAIRKVMDESTDTSLYGKNGHMWSQLICGRSGDTLIMNVPGPYTEAKAAVEAFLPLSSEGSIHEINKAMAEAVKTCYTGHPNF